MNKQTAFRRLGTMPDCSRNAVMTVEAVKRWIDLTADLGYTALMLYMEETYSVENQPYFGHLRGRYTPEELKAIDDYAAEKGMEFIPCIQALAHLGCLFHWDAYTPLRDCDDILLAGDERTYQLVEDMFASLRKVLRTNMLNVGMDEAFMLGRGKYQTLHGYEDRPEILVKHLARVAEIAKKYDFQLTIWGDMFFRLASGGEYYVDHIEVSDQVKAQIPDNVHLVYWDYYSTDKERYNRQIRNHNAIKDSCWFAGGLWTWGGFAPHNAYAINATTAAFRACLEKGVQDVFLTMWGDDGCECSMFAALPSLFYAARLAAGETDPDTIKAAFREKYGVSFDDFMLLDLPGTVNYSETEIVNPEKYLLYNDCFMGKFDANIQGGEGAGFGACADRLEKLVDLPEYGYLFRAQWALCRALELKCELGVRTRAAYLAGDKGALTDLLADYDELSRRLEVLYEAMEDQWMRENKPHGFDVQDIRLGGLACRVQHCRRRLAAYLEGTLPRIEELEEPVLPGPGLREGDAPRHVGYNLWSRTVTANVI